MEGDMEDVESKSIEKGAGPCHAGYLASAAGALRLLNIAIGITIFGLWIPGYEHDYRSPSQIVSFRDFSKNHGAGYKSETLNQFVLADIILCLMVSTVLLIGLIAIPQSPVDWNRMNKFIHLGLAMFHGIGTICAAVGIWCFEENCCRVDLEWNGIGFRYKPAIHEFGYPRNNFRCNCWLTKRTSTAETEASPYAQYTTELWEPEHYPDKYAGEESMFVSFASHHIHIHVAAVILMFINTGIYAIASYFSKPQQSSKIIDTVN